jgi:hypothetical protein
MARQGRVDKQFLQRLQEDFRDWDTIADSVALIVATLAVVALVIVVYFAVRHWDKLTFRFRSLVPFLVRSDRINRLLEQMRQDRKFIEIYSVGRRGRKRYVCMGRITEVRDKDFVLESLKCGPSIRNLPGRMCWFFFAPLQLDSRNYNAFTSPVDEVELSATTSKLVVRKPVAVQLQPRRKHFRQKIQDQRLVRVKVWDRVVASGHNPLPGEEAALEINTRRLARKPDARVADISVNGLGLSYAPDVESGELQEGEQVTLRVSVFDMDKQKYQVLWCKGLIRSRNRTREGRIFTGIQFYAVGMSADGTEKNMRWRDLDEETGIPVLSKLISGFQESADKNIQISVSEGS